jgi:ATP-dependent Clp protease ATP-binding subunit ClpB
VILFDEIEKAHHDVFNLLLQVLDDGRLTDGQGRTVDFRNTIIIMTSNIGSPYLTRNVSQTGEIPEEVRAQVMSDVRAHFRPEFLNRVDEIVLFKPLTLAEIERVVELQLKLVRDRLAERHIDLELSEAAKVYIARAGFDPVYGARPLKRFLQRTVETAIARRLLAGEIRESSRVVVDVEADQLVFHSEPLKPQFREAA